MTMLISSPKPLLITLTPEERAVADAHGQRKNDEAEARGKKADWTDSRGGSVVSNHQDGVAGEIAHFKSLGFALKDIIPRLTINNFKGADAGKNTEVRSTKQTFFGVKVKARDRDERIVVAYRQINRMTFAQLGWITVAEAKRIGKWDDPGKRGKPAFFVDDESLHPMATCPEDQV